MAAVLRFKRKASDEPAEGLVITLKKHKADVTEDCNEVYFKFAATVKNQEESVKDYIAAALLKETASKYTKWRNPKSIRRIQPYIDKKRDASKAEASQKCFNDVNDHRLKFTKVLPIEEISEQDSNGEHEVQSLFQLYDIIDETEDIKSKKGDESTQSSITCNGEPLLVEKTSDYVFDVYIADRDLDGSFVDSTISVKPYTLTENLGAFESDDENYEDDTDDSNDENNWRNEYPDEEKDFKDCTNLNGEDYDAEQYCEPDFLEDFSLEDNEDFDYPSYKLKVMKELDSEDDDS